jgi:transposase
MYHQTPAESHQSACGCRFTTRIRAPARAREAGRNVEAMWLTRRLAPDHKTIADFRKGGGPAIKQVCVQFANYAV